MKLIDLITQVDKGEILALSTIDKQDGLKLSGANLKYLESKIFECDEFKNVIRINFLDSPTYLADKETGEPISVNRNFVGGDVKPHNVVEYRLEEDCTLHLNKMVDIYSIELEKWYGVDTVVDKPGVWVLPTRYGSETFETKKEIRVIWEPNVLQEALKLSGTRETVKQRLLRMFQEALESNEPNTECSYSLKLRVSSRSVAKIDDPAEQEEEIKIAKTNDSDRETLS